MEVPGERRRGRPKRRWLDNIKNDLSERELSGEEAQGRIKMEASYNKHRPHVKGGKDAEEDSCTVMQVKAINQTVSLTQSNSSTITPVR